MSGLLFGWGELARAFPGGLDGSSTLSMPALVYDSLMGAGPAGNSESHDCNISWLSFVGQMFGHSSTLQQHWQGVEELADDNGLT